MSDIATLTFDEIRVGDASSFSVTITPELVDSFGALSGDVNPLHMDAEYAATTPFGTRIPHGMIAGALFSRLVGMYLPGTYAVYLGQSLSFPAPIAFGELLVRGEVMRKTEATQTISLATTATNADGSVCARGEALVRVFA